MANRDREAARMRAADMRASEVKRKRRSLVIKTLIAVVSVGAVTGIVVSAAINTNRTAEQKEQEVAALELNVPELATATGSFTIDSVGKAVPLTMANSEAPRVELIFDLHCGGCRLVETGIHETVESLIKNEEAQLFVTPVSFMNHASSDDYSARAGSTLVEVAETDPEHFFSYLTALYKNFPGVGKGYPAKGVSYKDLAYVAQSAGVSGEAIERFEEQRFRLWITENTAVSEQRKEVFPEGISTPMVLLGGQLVESDNSFVLEGFSRVEFNDADVDETFMEAFDLIR